ncbi:hypothetical protein BJ508DRAFT_316629 [Ascobolus immersus RN42]|uniref:FAD-binding FR-type domain-containing protein n=1 Tax=Ascobolus immersus RN42 TaxID=1160509 RepID=A0A3N4IQ28_ASCIM|nr:hypothetical protein BJ508DRAFT_316629 [Ascobolus immersus RN42]
MEKLDKKLEDDAKPPIYGIDFTKPGKKRQLASTHLLNLGLTKGGHVELDDSSATNLITGECCGGGIGGGCCKVAPNGDVTPGTPRLPDFEVPQNDAFRSLRINLRPLSRYAKLSGVPDLAPVDREIVPVKDIKHRSTCNLHPPTYVKPHPPHEVFSAKVASCRELTKPGAEKRTYHFDLDVTDYPDEGTNVDFVVGGAIGVCAPNPPTLVQEIFDRLKISKEEQDEPVLLHTQGGRWPTIWGEEEARTLTTTRRELLTWTVDVQSYAPKKDILRLLAEYAEDPNEQLILKYLCSRQGQAAFCELRTGQYVTLIQLLNAFPSSHPPFAELLQHLQALMPRFYSLSADPQLCKSGKKTRRTIEIAVTVHESKENWREGNRQGVGSGFFERTAKKFLEAQETGDLKTMRELRVPMFRGLMSNPLAKEFESDGPMVLIGAGVGIAPFRGFVQKRLQNANCINKVWVLQGIRDSLHDEIYQGEWGVEDEKVKKIVESRRPQEGKRYVQDEVRRQADLVWSVINALDGRVFVCGSSKGMGEGVEAALVDVAMEKGRLRREEAMEFWEKKRKGFQYVAETW